MGHLWETDSEGILLNDAHTKNIQTPYTAIIQEAVAGYTQHLGEYLHSIYVTGSVARGVARPGHSDLNLFAICNAWVNPEELDESWMPDLEEHLLQTYAENISDIQFELWSYGCVFEEPELFSLGALVIKSQGLCVWGSDINDHLPDFNLNREEIRLAIANDDIVQIETDIEDAITEIKAGSPRDIKYWCSRISKNILHTGWALATYDQPIYSRDLDIAHDYFTRKYPEKGADMQQAMTFTENPTSNADEILPLLQNFGAWMIAEANKWLDAYNPERNLAYIFDDTDGLE